MKYNIVYHPDYTALIDDQGNKIATLLGTVEQDDALLAQLNAGHRALQKKAPKQKCPNCKGSAHYVWTEGSLEPDRDGLTDFEVHVEHCAKCKGLGEIPA